MRKGRKSASNAPREKGGRLLLHLGPGLRQAIESDDVYEDWELTLDPPVNVVLPVSRSALPALWTAFGGE